VSVNVTIIGIRHHSPACAALVRDKIRALKPSYVLIEGPSDYNARISELLLDHQLPIALYSYSQTRYGMAQCWFPFLNYSPEWVALRDGAARGSTVRFIDLPHSHYRALPEHARKVSQLAHRDRYSRVTQTLCRKLQCDSDDVLWDHLFESAPREELEARLNEYFAHLHGDHHENTNPQDSAREEFMARYIAWAVNALEKALEQVKTSGASILVVCGGWHKPALEAMWPTFAAQTLTASTSDEPQFIASEDESSHELDQESVTAYVESAVSGEHLTTENKSGSYLMPYEYRQVDALGGYQSGMQSPLFYEWCWQSGAAVAINQAQDAIVQRLRAAKITLSTAEYIHLQHTVQQLAALRGHHAPTRADLLDAMQSVVIKEVMDEPSPWSEPQTLTVAVHPVLREALLALTGNAAGKLHQDTPEPPLVKHVHVLQAALDIAPTDLPRDLKLDRRDAKQAERAIALWRLHLLGLRYVQLKAVSAPRAARALPDALKYEEQWLLCKTSHDYAELIEASAYGATLEIAALEKLRARLKSTDPTDPTKTVPLATQVQVLNDALRAGYWQIGETLSQSIAAQLHNVHDHGELAAAANVLLDVSAVGFWGTDVSALFAQPLSLMLDRLSWLLDGITTTAPERMQADVNAVRCLARAVNLKVQLQDTFDTAFLTELFARIARRDIAAAALRGACVGAAFERDSVTADDLVAITRAIPAKDALGDYLFGLFALARGSARSEPRIAQAIHLALDSMSTNDFLVALPQLRGAFSWFPPRERGQLALHVAQLLNLPTGVSTASQSALLTRPIDVDTMVLAKQVEAMVDAWIGQYGIKYE
jgi:Family of unknown function (DUF5682)